MTSSGTVWKRASAVLAVLCALLGLANILLNRVSLSPDIANHAALEQSSRPVDVAPSLRPAEQDAALPQENADVKSPLGKNSEAEPPPEFPVPNPQSKIKNPPAVSPRPQAPEVVRPLGIVERADGRIQAVIEDGVSVQVVEVGQVLADNSRVVKISAESVELEPPPDEQGIQIAAGARSESASRRIRDAERVAEAPTGRTEEVELRWNEERPFPIGGPPRAVAASPAPAAPGVPGFEPGEASYKQPPPSNRAVTRQPVETSPAPTEGPDRLSGPRESAPAQSFPGSSQRGTLGIVALADGRVERIVADGPWVKLVPESAEPAKDVDSPDQGPEAQGPESLPSWQPVGESGKAVSGLDGAGGSILQDSVEPIGLVELADGRVQAVLARGDSVELVEDRAVVAQARWTLALGLPQRVPGEEPALMAAGLSAKAREDHVAAFRSSDGGESPGTPAGPIERSPPEPEEAARGHPEGGLAIAARAPPLRRAREDDFWQADLPGIEDTAAANISRSAASEGFPSRIPGEREDAGGISVSPGGVQKGDRGIASGPPALPQEGLEQNSGSPRASKIEALGFVRLADRRVQAVIAVGETTTLIKKGEELVDGTRVVEVTPGGVLLAPARVQSAASGGASAGHVEGPSPHLNPHQVAGSGLQSEAPLRNNRSQLRE